MDSFYSSLTLRDWVALGGFALIIVVLADAVRRLRHNDDFTMEITNKGLDGEEEADYSDFSLLSELPNGGARVVERDNLDTSICLDDAQNLSSISLVNEESGSSSKVQGDKSISSHRSDKSRSDKQRKEKLFFGEGTEVLTLNVIAKDDAIFYGDDVFKILLEHDLRFGDMQFFHRYEQAGGSGTILFSVANMMSPGVFDIDNMSILRMKGLAFFLTLPSPVNMISSFESMIDTATAVAEYLNGELRDSSRSVLTKQAIEYQRQKINELEHRRLAKVL